MSLALVSDVDAVGSWYLDRCAATIHAEYKRSLTALDESLDAYFAVGRALLDARTALRSDQAFGLWFREQRFGFNRSWAWTLRQAAEHEAEVRAAVVSQLTTGPPSIQKAVSEVRAAIVTTAREEQVIEATTAPPAPSDRIEQIRSLVEQGMKTPEIAGRLGVAPNYVNHLAKRAGIPMGKNSRVAVAERVERMRVLAAEGATSAQIAEELGIVIEVVRTYRARYNIDVPADATTNVRRQIDSTRIVAATIDAIDGIGAMFDHVDYAALPTEQISGWLAVLDSSIRSLTTMKKHLKKASQP